MRSKHIYILTKDRAAKWHTNSHQYILQFLVGHKFVPKWTVVKYWPI